MKRGELHSFAAATLAVGLAAAHAWAGSQGGHHLGGIPAFALTSMVAFLINWIAFLPAFLFQTERFYDLTGSATYLCVVAAAYSMGPQSPRAMMLGALVCIWALRLGTYLLVRVLVAGKDRRFDQIKSSWPRFLLAWTLQALWVQITAGAAMAAMMTARGGALDVLASAGAVVWLVGFSIEAVADRQKARFRADPANQGRFIASGLWAWSRHPNYFGEIVLWFGVALIALPSLRGWPLVTLVSPIFVTLLLTKVSGIPLLEEHADKTWGSDLAYRSYRESTPVLIPRPPLKQDEV